MKLLDVIEVGDLLGESPLWDPHTERLYWIDIHGLRLGVLDPASGDWRTLATGRRYGSIALTDEPGRLLAATASGLELIDVADSIRAVATLSRPERDLPGNRFNDGKTDRHGRFWSGTMEDAETGARTGSMYRLDLDGTVSRAWGDVGIPNGLCFSPDGTVMYSADSYDGELWAADYDPATGQPGPRRTIAVCEGPGGPDGSTVDAAGHIWNAEWGNSRLTRYRPDGSVERHLALDATKPTCPAFGGPDLELLFITTATVGGESGDHGGAILVYDAEVTGIAEAPYPASTHSKGD